MYISYMNVDSYLDKTLLFLACIYLINSSYIVYRFIRQKQTWQIYTFLYLASYAFILVFCYLYFQGYLGNFPNILALNMPALFILTSSAFLATRIVVYPDYAYSRKDLVHFLPTVIISVYFLIVCRLSGRGNWLWITDEYFKLTPFTENSDIYAAISLINILFYLGFQILEIAAKIFLKKEILKSRLHKNTLIMLLVIRSLNLGLPVMIFLELEFNFSLPVIKLTSIFLALNSLILTVSMAVYSYLFKIPKIPDAKSWLLRDIHSLTGEHNHWPQIKSILEKSMSESKVFKDEKLTVYSLAQQLNLSPRALSDYLNHSLQISFPEYITDLRIEEAKRLFQNTDLSVSEVTYECGFNSASKFFEHFRQKTGYSPAQFKKKIKQSPQIPKI